jgi:hypothetical protein
MWYYLNGICDTANPGYHDSLDHAFRDWSGLGLYGGFRLTEWAQEDGHSSIDNPCLDEQDVPRAFCLDDLEFRTHGNRRVSLEEAHDLPEDDIERTILVFSTQKNGNNGEPRIFTRNLANKDLCFVRQSLRIFKRFIKLVGWHRRQTPLCVYQSTEGSVKLITSSDICTQMRKAAQEVYNLHPVKDKAVLQLWSAHSLRVGACVILHSVGFSAAQIKFLLRWKSDSFMEYLRNLGVLSRQQNQAIADAATMPNFL